MPSIVVTRDAATELRRRIEESRLSNTVVAICRLDKGVDLKRGANGEALWTVEPSAISWTCEVVALPDGVVVPTLDAEGIRFAFAPNEFETIKRIEVALLNGAPHVHVDA